LWNSPERAGKNVFWVEVIRFAHERLQNQKDTDQRNETKRGNDEAIARPH